MNTELCGAFGGSYCDVQTVDFTLSSTANPISSNGYSFAANVQVLENTTGQFLTYQPTFYNLYGGTIIFFGEESEVTDSSVVLDGFGVESVLPITAGSNGDPTYLTGTFAAGGYYFNGSLALDSDNSLVVTDITTTPEPSSFLLLGTGLLGVAGVVRRRVA